jgi:ubiquitin-activating enzyme E1 C
VRISRVPGKAGADLAVCTSRQYTGTVGVYTNTFEYQKKPECPVCGGEVTEMTAPGDQTLEEFIEGLKLRADV